MQIAGVMAVTTAVTSYRNMQAYMFQLLVVGPMGTDVINLCCVSLSVVGLFNICIGAFKALHRYSTSFNQVYTNMIYHNYHIFFSVKYSVRLNSSFDFYLHRDSPGDATAPGRGSHFEDITPTWPRDLLASVSP